MAETPIAKAIIVEVAKLKLEPGEVLLVQVAHLDPRWASELWDTLTVNLEGYLGREVPVLIVDAAVRLTTMALPPEVMEHLVNQVAARLAKA